MSRQSSNEAPSEASAEPRSPTFLPTVMGDKIAGVLFDIGGVLVALDGVPSMAAFLGVEARHETLHALWMGSPSVVAHETGKIGAAEFAAGVVTDLKDGAGTVRRNSFEGRRLAWRWYARAASCCGHSRVAPRRAVQLDVSRHVRAFPNGEIR